MRDAQESIMVVVRQVNAKGASLQNLYFVVEPAQIVAQDLAHAIQAFDPEAQVRLFLRAAEALAALSLARPVAVLLHRDLNGEQTGRVADALRESGVPFAYTGGGPEACLGGAPVLASPFTEVTVAALLGRLLGQVAEAEDED
jgi:hypothetical protein